jgi:PhnB protein
MARKTRKATRTRKSTRRRPARRKVQAIPAAYGSVTPHLVLKDSARAIDFYAKAFGAKTISRMAGPGGGTMHAEIKIGDTVVMMGDESPDRGVLSAESLGGSPTGLMLYVRDCDAVFSRAVAAGAKPVMPPADMFWGDRYGQLVDPFGHRWAIATHKVDMTHRQMEKAGAEFMAKAAQGPPQ